MSNERVTTTDMLQQHIKRDWRSINLVLKGLSKKQWLAIKNLDGWTVKDHVAHLTIWERSVIAMLTGHSQYQSLGVSKALYDSEDYNAINQIIFERHRDDELEVVQSRFQSTHNELMSLIESLSDADVNQPCSHYLPNEMDNDVPAINIIYGNTAHHYRIHQRWIEEMLVVT